MFKKLPGAIHGLNHTCSASDIAIGIVVHGKSGIGSVNRMLAGSVAIKITQFVECPYLTAS